MTDTTRPLVVNFHNYHSIQALTDAFGDRWAYVGRPNRTYNLPGSPLANPYSTDPRNRSTRYSEDPISDYRLWLWRQIKGGNQKVLQALDSLSLDSVLVCWCAPGDCHADVIAAAVRWRIQNFMIKTISLWQPWASLVEIGTKLYETRSWGTTYRGPLAIHASKHFGRAEKSLCLEEPFRSCLFAGGYDGAEDLPLGCVVAVVELTGIFQTEAIRDRLTGQERRFGDYNVGRFAWRLENVRRLPEPVLTRGYQQLFDWQPPAHVVEWLKGDAGVPVAHNSAQIAG
ncbi:MAG: DUF4326 domain-containing protein [Chloroflexi bacterium]|nr:DUF4326 domain-containing protein [Chloroflexota bacterium]